MREGQKERAEREREEKEGGMEGIYIVVIESCPAS